MEEQITIRQTACFCVISMIALKIIELPSLLFKDASSSGLIVGAISFLIDIIALFIFLKAKEKYPNYSLYELLKMFLGEVVSKVVYVLLFMFFIFKLLTLMNEAVAYMQAIVDEDYTTIMFLITFVPVISCVAHSGLKCTARSFEFGYIFIFIGLVICIILSDTSLTFGLTGPLFEQPFSVIMESVFNLNFYFSDFIFVAIFSDKIKYEKNMKKTIFSYVFLFLFITFFIHFVYFRLFRGTSYLHKNAIEDITQYNRNIGNVGNVDIISILTYLFVIFFQGSLYMNSLKNIYQKVLGYNNSTHAIIFIDLIIVFVMYFYLFNLSNMVEFIVNYLKYFSVLMIFIPIYYLFLLIFDRSANVKKKYK